MREVKFRAWLQEEKKMVQVEKIEFYGNEMSIYADGEWYYHITELMQFTGLTDKNGKKIFEGDIVELYKELFEVKFEYSEWKLRIISKRVFMSPVFYSHAKLCEVIGNIHDNSKLVEVEK